MPATRDPSAFNSAAVADESTPPDMATTTLVSRGRPSISRLLSMVPVIGAIASASRSYGSWRRDRLVGTIAKPPFNIGRICMRQSRQTVLRHVNGKSCRRAERYLEGLRAIRAPRHQLIEKYRSFFHPRMARSLLSCRRVLWQGAG